MEIAMRSGQDSDCNPASVNGILLTAKGIDGVPGEMLARLDRDRKWAYTDYDFESLLDVSEKLARQSVIQAGGRIEKDDTGQEIFLIPVQNPKPGPLEQSWNPGPPANSLYTDEQMQQIDYPAAGLNRDVQAFVPGWQVDECGDDPMLGLVGEIDGEASVLLTTPSDSGACILSTTFRGTMKSVLRLKVGNTRGGQWDLVVRANGNELLRQVISKRTTSDTWLKVEIPLNQYAGEEVRLEIANEGNTLRLPFAYWATIDLEE